MNMYTTSLTVKIYFETVPDLSPQTWWRVPEYLTLSRKSSHHWVILNDKYLTVWIAVHNLKSSKCSPGISDKKPHCLSKFSIALKIHPWLDWWKGKPSGSIACTRKQQLRCYWSCSSLVMNDATPLTPPSAFWAELHFQM